MAFGETAMPLYEYRCDDCQACFEILQRMGEGASDLECPSCGGTELAKQFSTFAAASSSGSAARNTASEAAGCGAPACGTGFS